MTNKELFDFCENEFRSQLGLELSEVVVLEGDALSITRDNRLGVSIASLKLDLDLDGHKKMARFLEALE